MPLLPLLPLLSLLLQAVVDSGLDVSALCSAAVQSAISAANIYRIG